MKSLRSSLREAEGMGEPLPPVWQEFVQLGVEFRRGSLCLVAAAPGIGKSLVANTLAVRARTPSLYFSADTDAYTVSTRIGAMLLGDTINNMESRLSEDVVAARLASLDYLRWCFDPSVDIDRIVDDVRAFDMLYGEPPHLIVIDNLSNMFSPEPNPYLAHRFNMEALNILAKETGACVVVLHHLTGEYESGDRPPPMGSIEGKIAKLPGLVLTMFRGKYGDIGVCVCKNRFGPAEPGGGLRCYLKADLERVRIG